MSLPCFYNSTMQGIPASGNIAQMLKTCLVTGFNQLTLDSIVVTDGIARCNRALGHGYQKHQVVEIAGATPGGLNGKFRVTESQLTYFTFAVALADQTASGTITAKSAGAGWEVAFESGNKIAFRSPNSLSPRSFFLVDGTAGNQDARVLRAFEGMADIDDTTGNGWGYTYISDFLWGGTWYVFADDRTAYWKQRVSSYSNYRFANCGMGDFVSFIPGDQFNDFTAGHQSGTQGSTTPYSWAASPICSANSGYVYCHRDKLGTTFGPAFYAMGQANGYSGYGGPSFPSLVDNGMLITDTIMRESGGTLRGKLRGAFWPLCNLPLTNTIPGSRITGVSGLEGRVLELAVVHQGDSSITESAERGRIAYDITGPWEN